MRNHYYDENGVYVFSAEANPGTLPPDRALRVAPPEQPGFWPVLNDAGDGWTLVEDHRGEKGWRGGAPSRIDALGPLPEDWSAEPPRPPEMTDPDELRRMAFAAEADPHRDAALSYRLEAEALRLSGDIAAADRAEAKCRRELIRYRDKKAEVRSRYPKDDSVSGSVAVAESNSTATADDALVYLTHADTYHREGCGYTRVAGEWMRLSAAMAARPGARPCARCKPLATASQTARQ